MKISTIAILTLVVCLSAAAFGQKPEAAKPAMTATTKLPTVAEILANYVRAIGGREANEKIKSRSVKGTVSLSPMGVSGTYETLVAAESRSVTVMNLQGVGEMKEGFDGKIGWSVNPLQGSRERSGLELKQQMLINNFYRDINLDKLYSKMELKGTEKIGTQEAYVIVATAGELPSETYYFDTKSGFMLRNDATLIAPEGNQPAKIYYEDLRAVDGVMIPYRVRTQLPSFEIVLTITELKNNVAVDEAKFTKPKQ